MTPCKACKTPAACKKGGCAAEAKMERSKADMAQDRKQMLASGKVPADKKRTGGYY